MDQERKAHDSGFSDSQPTSWDAHQRQPSLTDAHPRQPSSTDPASVMEVGPVPTTTDGRMICYAHGLDVPPVLEEPETHVDVPDADLEDIVSTAMKHSYAASNGSIHAFLRKYAKPITDPTDDTYNVIDQHSNKKWSVPAAQMSDFFNICEQMRKDKQPHGMSTRQREAARMFIDFDFLLATGDSISHDLTLARDLVRTTSRLILKDVVRTAEYQTDVSFNVLVTGRDHTTFDPDANGHKDGVHIYMDFFTSQVFRKYKIGEMARSAEFVASSPIFSDWSDRIINKKSTMDANSPNVWPMVIGATKAGGVNYSPVVGFRVTFDYEKRAAKVGDLPAEVWSAWHMAGWFSPTFISHLGPPKVVLSLAPSIEAELTETARRISSGMEAEEIEDLDMTSATNPQAREIQAILPLLSNARSDTYDSWFKTLIVLARYGEKFKPIARAFSMKSAKYDERSFNEQWVKSLHDTLRYPNCNIGMLYRWAKNDDPVAYREITSKFVNNCISRHVFESISFMDSKIAHLGDFQMADILHTAYPNLYIAIPKRTSTGKRMTDDSDVNYYSLILPSAKDYQDGMAYKYCEVMNTAPIQLYISQKMPLLLRQVRDYFRRKSEEANQSDRDRQRFIYACSVVGRAFASCMSHGAKQSIMREYAYLTMNFRFENEVDSYPYVIGIHDALLDVGIEPRIIRAPCDYMITRTSLAKYKQFDPTDPFIVRPMQWLIDFIPTDKFDKLLYLLIYMCQVLSNVNKSLMLLNITGGGSNAKSTIMQFLLNTLGDVNAHGYAYKMSIDYLTTARANSGAAQPELVPIQFARLVMLSEPSSFQRLNENKVKTILAGETISGRGLYKDEMNFKPRAIFTCLSNPPLRFDDGGSQNKKYTYDYGTIRRLGVFKAECKFTTTPDPADPLQRSADPAIEKVHIYNPHYQGGLLSILAMVFALFKMMHNEEIEYVCSPNVLKETEDHISSFDLINLFITRTFVHAPGHVGKLEGVIDNFIAWLDKEHGTSHHNRDAIRSGFILSRVTKHIKAQDDGFWIYDCYALAIGASPAPGETRFHHEDDFKFTDYTEFKLPTKRHKLPFDGKLKKTADATTFLRQLGELYVSELAAYKARAPTDERDPRTGTGAASGTTSSNSGADARHDSAGTGISSKSTE